MSLQEILDLTIANADGYKFGKIKITHKVIAGSKVGYAGGSKRGAGVVAGYIVIDSRFIDYCRDDQTELINTVKHELAHLIAETFNKKKKTGVWHGKAWQDIHVALGGNGDRYYKGSFVKPENVGKNIKTREQLAGILPTQPKEDFERGTYRQWLERGYHVIKGQKGQLQVWEFNSNEYETAEDGKTSTWGRAAAVYFTPDQVEANTAKESK
jgi:hypothetical protein